MMNRPRIPLTIYHPELVPVTKRGVLLFIFSIGWLLWFYIMLPVIAALGWLFGYHRLDVFVLSDPAQTFQTLRIYGLIITAGGMLFIFWAVYNWLRFRNYDRRGTPIPASAQDIAQIFKLEEEAVLWARQQKIIDFSFDAAGQIIRIEPHQKQGADRR